MNSTLHILYHAKERLNTPNIIIIDQDTSVVKYFEAQTGTKWNCHKTTNNIMESFWFPTLLPTNPLAHPFMPVMLSF